MEKRRVAVRTLVETVLRSGSLSPIGNTMRMLEGMKGHRAIQQVYEEGTVNERSVSIKLDCGEFELTVYGRIDRLHGAHEVEEIKTTYAELDGFERAGEMHKSQALVYAHMFVCETGLDGIDVTVTYLNLADGEMRHFTTHESASSLKAHFDGLIELYLKKLNAEREHTRALRAQLAKAGFPFESYREGQRTLAAHAYTAIKRNTELLCEAPTGTGKTMAVIYPALKAIGEGLIEKAFWLTARTTQQSAALDAVERLSLGELKTVVLSARKKMCIHETPRCREGDCPRQTGYYDRLDAALAEFMEDSLAYTRERVNELANRHTLCPFELAFDLSELSDLIICDYNYVFDPRVRLERFFKKSRINAALLIDEAHNLPDRAREMYSARISVTDVETVRKTVNKERRKTPAYRALLKLKKAISAYCESCINELDGVSADAPKKELSDAIMLVSELYAENANDASPAEARELVFTIAGFLYALGRYDEDYVTVCEGKKGSYSVTLFACDPSKRLASAYKQVSSSVLFSATLTPHAFYRDTLGLTPDTATLSVASPFPKENLIVMNLPINTRYRARERTNTEIAEAIAAFVTSRKNGNYLVFFPSYAYLQLVSEALKPELIDADTNVLVQTGDMDDEARARFIAAFENAPVGVNVGLAVTGGAFAESIDLADERLCGVAIVGVGLPRLCRERDVLMKLSEEKYGAGYHYAYAYPGFARVMQASGRLIRTHTDRGALLLIDSRYTDADYTALMPESWDVVRVHSAIDIRAVCRDFFKT